MKKIIALSAFFVLIFSVQSNAQTTNQPDSGSKHHNVQKDKKGKSDLKSQLGLTDDQSKKLAQYDKDAKQKKDAIKTNKDLSQEEKTKQLKALKDEKNKNVSSVLTKDQQTKMQEIKKQHKNKNKGNTPAPQATDAHA